MKTLFTLLVMQLVCCITFASTPTDNKKITVNGLDQSYYRIVPMPDGGSLLVSNNNLSSTHMLIRLNAQGQAQWTKSFIAQAGASYFHDAGPFADNSIYVVYGKDGYGDYFIIKLTAAGEVQWTDEFNFGGVCFEAPVTVRTLADGGLIFVPRLFASLAAIRLDGTGAVVSSYRTTDTTGKVMSMDAFPTITGGMVVTGKKDSKPLIITVTPNSPPQVVSFQGGSYNRPYSIIESYDGNYLLGGLSNDGNGAFIIKITPGGTVLWRNIYSALLQVAGSKRLVALTQLIENADHTISAVGYGASDNLDPGSALGVFMKLSATGEPLSSYSFVTRGLDGFINDIYPRMYETGNQLMISTEEFDTTTGTVQPVLINPEKLGDYCKAFAFTPTVMAMQFSTTTGGTPVTLGVVPAATHPVIVTQNATGGLSVKDLCGLTATSLDVLGSDKGITLQPNPVSANGEVTVKWSHSQLPNGSILLYDVAGRLVKQINVTQGSQATFSTTNLQPGMYMCQLVNAANEKVATQKLLVTE